MTDYAPDLTRISTFIFDVDGVMTNGILYCFENGEQVRGFNIKDGFALKQALKKGFRVAVISGKNEPSVRQRLTGLGISDLYMGSDNKLDEFENYLYRQNIHPATVVYMGDDVPDLEVMQRCGLAACPADACDDVLEICDFVSQYNGGQGAVRDLIEQVLKAQGKWI